MGLIARASPYGTIISNGYTLHASVVGAVALIGFIYLAVAAVLPPGGIYIGDQGVKFAQIDALARTGSIAIGSIDDPINVYRPAFNGAFYYQVSTHYQSIFSPAYAAVVVPFYLAFGFWGLVVPSLLTAALAAFAAARIAQCLGVARPWAVALLVGLGTPVAFYALVLWEHAPSTGLLIWACYLALRRRVVAAGLVSALAVWFRPESYLFAAGIGIGALVAFGPRGGFHFGVRYALGFVGGALPWWLYNLRTVGSLLGLSAKTAYGRTEGAVSGNALASVSPLANQLQLISSYVLPIGLKKWALLLILTCIVTFVLYWKRRSVRPALWLLWLGVPFVAMAEWTSGTITPVHSITDAFPFVFAVLVPGVLLSRNPRVRFLWTIIGVYIAGAVAMTLADPANHPGGEWGPRYLLPIFPLLAVLAWLGFESAQRGMERRVLVVLLAFSLVLQAVGVVYLATEEQRWAGLTAEIDDLEPRAVATAVWWLPQVAAATLSDVRWYGVVDESDLDRLAGQSEGFWWIWAPDDPDGVPGRVLQTSAVLPTEHFVPVASKKLSTRGLEAVLYRVVTNP